MKILVTGAAGFIGSYVSRALIWRGDNVVGIDNFNEYYPRSCKEYNLDLIRLASKQNPVTFNINDLSPVYEKLVDYSVARGQSGLGSFEFSEVDITDDSKIKDTFSSHNFDAVIHLAAMAGVPYSIQNPQIYAAVNVLGTVNLLKACKEKEVKKFVFGSSSSVYGNRDDKKVSEEDDVTKTVSPYGATKVAGEVLCHAASAVYGVNVVVDRIFGPIYGPLQRTYGMFMQRAINYAYNDKELSIYGAKGLKSAKDSTYIDDQVRGLISCLDYQSNFDIFNIGTSDPQSIEVWLNEIEKNLGKKVRYKIVEVDKGDVASSADILKAQKLLNYSPKVTISEGVKRQVEIFNLMPSWYKMLEKV